MMFISSRHWVGFVASFQSKKKVTDIAFTIDFELV